MSTETENKERKIPGLERKGPSEFEAFSMLLAHQTERIIYPVEPGSEERVKEIVTKWKEKGCYWGLYTGCFDVMHPNHQWALIRARIEVAKGYAARYEVDWNKMNDGEKRYLLASDKIKLMVSVDGDNHVAERKSLKTSKGSTIRPVQTWSQRASAVSTMMIPSNESGLYRPVADLVVSHDKYDYQGTMFQDQWQIGIALKPDFWMVAATDPANAREVEALKTGAEIRLLPEGTIVDPLTGEMYSTSGTLERVVKSVEDSLQ
jgi:hypothetical protein